MLAVSPFRREGETENTFPMGEIGDEFPDFCGDNLLDSIDFDELFVGIEIDGDVLPDLEVDGGDFSVSAGEDSSEMNTFTSVSFEKTEEDNKVSGSGSAGSSLIQEEEIVSKRENESDAVVINSSRKEGHEKRKKSKNRHGNGKRKVKVDWTPELHKRFVQAVEQLGVDKAVPSRILELMGIDCLTRHNIASHLQKYRSHRKHLIAREAEAASWSHKRQMYGGGSGSGGGMKREMTSNNSPWLGVAPTMGFPPMAPPPPIMPHHFRPLHVWGHPHVDRSLGRIWPKQIVPSSLPPHFAHPPPPPGSSFWHAHHQRVPNSFTPGTPYFPPTPQLAPSRLPNQPVQGIPTHAMYKVDAGSGAPLTNSPTGPPLVDFHPSKESIDAAIGDVLSEPWRPLPLGLNPPCLDSVMVELNLQGIPKIPPC
ncbi:hypothetical protein LguiB_029688 [Lonicera macranthoides]